MASFSVDLDKLRERVRASRNSFNQQPAHTAVSDQANKFSSSTERVQGSRDGEGKAYDKKKSYDDFIKSVLHGKPSPEKGGSVRGSAESAVRPGDGLHPRQHLPIHSQHIPQGHTLLRSAVKPGHGNSFNELQRCT